MLPLHREGGQSSAALSRLANSSKPLLTKLLLRWLVLACTVGALMWMMGPLMLDFFRFGESGSEVRLDVGVPPTFEDVEGPEVPKHHTPSTQPAKVADNHSGSNTWDERKGEVREAFRHAWQGYMKHAYPADELLPQSGQSSNKYNGWAVTLYDSLDSLWIMGLKDEFNEAMKHVREKRFMPTQPDHYAPFFETTIRYLGGALSAYALSKDPALLERADDLGKILLPAFNGTSSGLPAYSVHVETGHIKADNYQRTVLFAEATTCQLEFKYLAKITGKREYYTVVQKAMNVFYKANVSDGLFADKWQMEDGKPSGHHYTIGATADSGYEYLLKQWLLSGDVDARTQYIRSANGIIENLVYVTANRGLLYAGDLASGYYTHRLEHLSCYLPGVLALGAHTLPRGVLSEEDRQMHLWAARGIGYTCATSYADTKSGLGPDEMTMPQQGRKWVDEIKKWRMGGAKGLPPGLGEPPAERDSGKRDYFGNWYMSYLLRPETVETLFYLWKVTGDVKWRERGYGIFKAIEKYTKTPMGYSTVRDVDSDRIMILDDMPSWFLAETLKYLYLLMDDNDTIPLSKWVFNTEAHPLPVFEWTKEEKEKLGVNELHLGI